MELIKRYIQKNKNQYMLAVLLAVLLFYWLFYWQFWA